MAVPALAGIAPSCPFFATGRRSEAPRSHRSLYV
jgi:hypothetical protein